MNAVDVIILVAVVLFSIIGWYEGLVRALWAFVGWMTGAALGIAVVPFLLGSMHLSIWVAILAVTTVGACALGGRYVAVAAEKRLRAGVGWTPRGWIDHPGGAVFGLVATLGVSWMLGLALAGSSLPDAATAANTSRVLRLLEQAHLPVSRLLVDRFAHLGSNSDFPRYVDALTAERIVEVPPPPPAIVDAVGVAAAASSVYKIESRPTGIVANQGTGFAIAPERLMTVAHVVGDAVELSVETDRGTLPATVVVCDPDHDVAVIDVPGLAGRPLSFGIAAAGEGAAIIGYPGNGGLKGSAARVRQRQEFQSPDIWGEGRYVHDGYTVRGDVRSGGSGGPLVDRSGSVLGVVVASSRADRETGYALTSGQVRDALLAGLEGRPGGEGCRR